MRRVRVWGVVENKKISIELIWWLDILPDSGWVSAGDEHLDLLEIHIYTLTAISGQFCHEAMSDGCCI